MKLNLFFCISLKSFNCFKSRTVQISHRQYTTQGLSETAGRQFSKGSFFVLQFRAARQFLNKCFLTPVIHDFNLFYFTFDTNILVLVFTHIFTIPLFILSLFPLIFLSSSPSSVFRQFFLSSAFITQLFSCLCLSC